MNIKLNKLLELHDSNIESPSALAHSLGDGILYESNPVYRKIRDQFLKMGFQYTTNDFCHYAVLPYASLPVILKEKKVPYFDNVTVLREIEKSHPGRFQCEELIKVKSNYVFHESSHCLAENFLTHLDSTIKTLPLPPEGQKAFRMVMAESFANSIESFANFYNKSPEQRFFYELNSYIIHHKKVSSALAQSIDLLGEALTFQLVYISYLYSNCLFPEPNMKTYQQILEIIVTDPNLRKKAFDAAGPRKTFNYAFELSADFRLQTTGFFLAYSGLNTPMMKLLNIDILEILKKSSLIPQFLRSFPI